MQEWELEPGNRGQRRSALHEVRGEDDARPIRNLTPIFIIMAITFVVFVGLWVLSGLGRDRLIAPVHALLAATTEFHVPHSAD